MISTRTLECLPDISTLRQICQSIAMLDAILEPEWEFRYYSFNSNWAQSEEMASMRDGSGSQYFILFNPVGVIIKGFDLDSFFGQWTGETESIWPGILDQVPAEFDGFLKEPAFVLSETTFCIWRAMTDPEWHIGEIEFPQAEEDPDGSARLLEILDGRPETYQVWAEDYFERHIPLEPIQAIYRHEPLTEILVTALNPELTLADLEADIREIGYPI